MKTYTIKAVILALSISLISCGHKDKNTAADSAAPIPVTISPVQANGTQPFMSASGKIEAVNNANLSTRMMGFVKSVHVKVGDKVRQGQLLVAINNQDLQAKRAQVNASITQATAAFNNAKKDYERFKALFAQNSASQKEMDDMTAHYEMAKAGLEAANQMKNEINAQFAYANITAPFSGVVTNLFVEEGDMANPGMPLVAVESPGKFEVTAMVPESDIAQISSGIPVNIIVKSLGITTTGKVTEVSTSAKNTGGQYLVKAVLDPTDANILSGMFATVQFPVASKSKNAVVMVPKSALVERGQLTGVYTLSSQSTAVLRWITLGKTIGDQVEVLSGLNTEESFITSADGKLYNGAKVSVK